MSDFFFFFNNDTREEGKFRYQRDEDGRYYFYEGDNRVKCPDGCDLWASNYNLATTVLEALAKDPTNYTDPRSILTYQFSYCQLLNQYNDPSKAKEDYVRERSFFSGMLRMDPFLPMDHEGESLDALAQAKSQTIRDEIIAMTINEFVTFVVMEQSIGTMMLPLRLITDLLRCKLDDEKVYRRVRPSMRQCTPKEEFVCKIEAHSKSISCPVPHEVIRDWVESAVIFNKLNTD